MNSALVPETVITASECLVRLVPDTWAIEWTNHTTEERRESALHFGLDDSARVALTHYCTNALDTGALGWPSTFTDLFTARAVRETFLSTAPKLVIFGIALPHDLLENFLDASRPPPGHGEPGVFTALTHGVSPDPSGLSLGFDVLGWDHSLFHSYLCNGLENSFAETLGITPNRHGFFDHLTDARKCAAYAGLDSTHAEPALWLPWQTLLY